jgi:serine/threonine protein kinase
MKFIYNSGQRPLDGYTLKRGIGRGGFGEVYYAVSDGGKEVALKLVRGGNQEIELRGMAQCLNLKHPHLVSLYDMRRDVQGENWVVMEYISGEPLSVVLNRHPHGLPQELAQQWFLALSRAVAYLHDHGIVHRDLKPANIFVENGLVKVGDYGLCKFISGSHRTAQTQSVGTVHYMAPEISTGNYNKQIDIYAAGIILYEMLTGRVPFEGESAGEILMKHLTAPPDLSKLPSDYVAIVGKALAKNPAHRYASLAEMAKAFEGLGKEGRPVVRAAPLPPPPPAPPAPVPRRVVPRPEPIPNVLPVRSFRMQASELCGSLAMAALLSAVSTTLYAALSRGSFDPADTSAHTAIGAEFFLTVAVCWAVLIPAKFWSGQRGDSMARRVVMMVLGLGIGLVALWLDPPWTGDATTALKSSALTDVARYLSYFALAFFALRWWKLADRRRPNRFSIAPILAAGFWGLILLCLWVGGGPSPEPTWREPSHWLWQGTLVLTTASAIVQLVSPWEQSPPPVPRRMRLRCA